MKAKFSLAVILLALTGCATVYQYQPAPGEQTAILKLGVAKIPFVSLSENEGCPKKRMDQSQASTVIPANKRLWVEPGFSSLGLPGGTECIIPMSFVAQAGKEYFVVYETAGLSCNARILTRNEAGKLALEPTLKREKFERCMM